MSFPDTMAPTNGGDRIYNSFSATQTRAALPELEALSHDVQALYPAEAVTFMALTEQVEFSGLSAPVHGIVGLKADLLRNSPEVGTFIGVHEAVHTRLGGTALRGLIDVVAPQLQEYFRGQLIPAWLSGRIDFSVNTDYLRSRNWDGLCPNRWQGPQRVNSEQVSGAVENFFSLVIRDQITSYGDQWSHEDTRFPDYWEETMREPILDPSSAFAERQEWLATMMLTGYEMGEDLLRCYRDSQLNFTGVDMWELEEGFVNYVAHGLTGVPFETVQTAAPQHKSTLALARRFFDIGIPPQALVETVSNYQDLYQFIRTALQP